MMQLGSVAQTGGNVFPHRFALRSFDRCRDSGSALRPPEPGSIFEVRVGDAVHHTTWNAVLAWANRQANHVK
jgi:hypothetical protein